MLKVNDGGNQESAVARPFVVVLLCSGRIVVGSRGGCKVRKGKQVQGVESA